MACPGESVILEFVEGSLPGASAEDLHVHLDACGTCQRLVAELARNGDTGISGGGAGEPRTLEQGERLDRYVILEPLGVGGMGVVYAAFDPQLDRKVALKLLRPDARGAADEHRTRLLHEAQALARLSHPHVVTVHEIKAVGEHLFVVMELVEGTTLSQWLEQPRPWREVIEVFLKAGQGLRAAHEAGLVHRDFKPSNVLIGKDGQVRVMDFGLARLEGRDAPTEARAGDSPAPEGSKSVTRTGSLLGTPAYMAPEQWSGQPADARSDQFSFCVALHEGLYGARPFQGDSMADLRAAVRKGEVPPPPRGTKVPTRVRRILLRGLKLDPAERYPSMRELLADLERIPLSAGRVALWAAAGVVLLAVGVAIGGGRSVDPRSFLCTGGERKLAGIWDPARKAQVRAALIGTGAGTPYAEGVWRGVERALDAYSQSWVSMYTESCEATRVRGERSEALLDLQVMCLERHARDLQAVTDLYLRTRSQSVETAVQAAYALPPLKECAETDALAAQVKAPQDPAQRARVEEIHRRLSEVRALISAGKNVPALEKAEAVVALADQVQHEPTRAEAYYVLGHLRKKGGEAQKAQDALFKAAWAAEAGHHDRLAARARIELVPVIIEATGRPQAAAPALSEAEAALARVGSDPDMASLLESARGGQLVAQEKCQDALPRYKRALELADQAQEGDKPWRAELLESLGKALRCAGDLPAAQARHEEALALRERIYGRVHPEVASSLNYLANVLFAMDHPDQALPLHERALSIREETLGAHAVLVADSLVNVGADLAHLKRYADSRDYLRRAVAIYEDVLGPDNVRLVTPLINLGDVQVYLHEPEEAVRVLDRALKILPAREGEKMAYVRFNLARALRLTRDEKRARELAHEARAYFSSRKDAFQIELNEIDEWLHQSRAM